MNNEFNFQPTAAPQKKNGYAIASLVLGIVSLLFCCCCCANVFGLIPMGICAVLAIVFAFLSKKDGGKMQAIAIAGLVLGIVSILVLLLFLVAIIGTYTMIDALPQEELLAFVEETYKPMFEGGNEATYNELVEAIKSIYATRGK